MYINTNVVRALMHLREIHTGTIAKVAGISQGLVERWLMNKGPNSEEAVPTDMQYDILQYVGIKNGVLRGDVVHYWHVQEPFFGDAAEIYKPLFVVLTVFGEAAVTFLTKEIEPSASFKNESYFGLKFAGFTAVLRVTGHPLASRKFSPEKLPGLRWADGGHGVLLDDEDYLSISKAEVAPSVMNKTLTAVPDLLAWEKLVELAKSLKLEHNEVSQAIQQLACAKDSLPAPVVAEPVQEKVQEAPFVPNSQSQLFEAYPVDVKPAPQEKVINPRPAGGLYRAR